MKYAICNEVFENWTTDATFKYVAGVGYDGIEIAPFTLCKSVFELDPERRTAIRDEAADAGIDIVGLHWVLVGPEGLHVTSPDKDVRERTVQYLIELANCCADLGGSVVVFGSPKQRSMVEGVTRDKAVEYAADVFLRAAERGAERDVTFALEPLTQAETNFLTTHTETIELIERINHPNVRLHLDVKAMSAEDMPIPDIIRGSRDHLAHFHANDANLRGPGFGDVDFGPIIGALREIEYAGYVSVEVFDFSPDPETIATRSLEYLKKF